MYQLHRHINTENPLLNVSGGRLGVVVESRSHIWLFTSFLYSFFISLYLKYKDQDHETEITHEILTEL